MRRSPAGPMMTHAWLFIGPPAQGARMRRSPSGAALVCPTAAAECVRTASRCWVGAPRRGGRAPRRAVLQDRGGPLAGGALRHGPDPRTLARHRDGGRRPPDRVGQNVLLKGIPEPPAAPSGCCAHRAWRICCPPSGPAVRSWACAPRPPTRFRRSCSSRGGCGDGSFRRACLHGTHRPGRALATIESVRNRRHDVLIMMRDLSDLAGCMAAAETSWRPRKPTPSAAGRTRRHREADDAAGAGCRCGGQRVKRVTKSALKGSGGPAERVVPDRARRT